MRPLVLWSVRGSKSVEAGVFSRGAAEPQSRGPQPRPRLVFVCIEQGAFGVGGAAAVDSQGSECVRPAGQLRLVGLHSVALSVSE